MLLAEKPYHFVQITDLHLEPFYSPERHHEKKDVCRAKEAYNHSECVAFEVLPINGSYPWGRLNCDPPMSLLRSMAQSIRNVSKQTPPAFILFTGDAPSHSLSCQHHAARAIELVVQLMSQEFSDVAPVYPMMGNNDYFPNYNVSLLPNNNWQVYIGSMYKRWGMLSGEQLKTFRRGGYYSVSPKPGLKVLVLNTVVWSHKVLDWGRSPKVVIDASQVTNQSAYLGPDAPFPDAANNDGWAWNAQNVQKGVFLRCGDRPPDPYGQLAWARRELEQSRALGQRVLVAGHVPPGNKVGENNFCTMYNDAMIQLARDFADTIEVQLYGDHSTDEFRMFWSEGTDGQEPHAISSVLVSAGVTPRKHCNPSWRMFDVSADHHVMDFTQYFFQLINANIPMKQPPHNFPKGPQQENLLFDAGAKWWRKQYSFREEYGVGLSPSALESLWLDMQSKPQVLYRYMGNMFSQTIGTKDYFDYLCDMRYIEKPRNFLCAQKGRLLDVDNPQDQAAVAKIAAQMKVMADMRKSAEVAPNPAMGTHLRGEEAVPLGPAVIGCVVFGTTTILFAVTTVLLACKLSKAKNARHGRPLLS